MDADLPTRVAGEAILYVVATPIGNRKDITLRALDILREVDWIACEDTRQTGRFIRWFDIDKGLISLHEHNEVHRTPQIVERLKNGESVALVSDAGMPLISDPGHRLVRAAIDAGVAVIPIPGASAPSSALSVSGLPSDAFVFLGFPPKKPGKRQKFLEQLSGETKTVILFESPKRICALLEGIQETMGDRNVMVAREMTKLHEEYLRGTVSQILENLRGREDIKGEVTFVMEGAPAGGEIDEASIREEIRTELDRGDAGVSEISRRISARHGISRSSIYRQALDIMQNDSPAVAPEAPKTGKRSEQGAEKA